MTTLVTCPRCGRPGVDLAHYDTMMVVSPHQAVFTATCSQCGRKVTGMWHIPDQLQGQVRETAERIHAGMGQSHPGGFDSDADFSGPLTGRRG